MQLRSSAIMAAPLCVFHLGPENSSGHCRLTMLQIVQDLYDGTFEISLSTNPDIQVSIIKGRTGANTPA